MFRKAASWLLAVSALAGGGDYASACGNYCQVQNPEGSKWVWQDTPCGQPANVTVQVDGSLSTSLVCITGGWNIAVSIPQGAAGTYSVHVTMASPANLANLVISGPSDVPVNLYLNRVLNAGSIRRTDGGALYVKGTILGNLGSLSASHLFIPGELGGLVVEGDVTGPVTLLDVPALPLARGTLTIN